VRARTLFLVSVVLNVALSVALVTWISSTRNASRHVVRPVSAATIDSNLVRIIKTNVLVRPRAFTWQEVESADYAVYVENLRALGMPESTVRDVIVADVDQIYHQRRRAEAAQQDVEWWRSTPSPEVQSNNLARIAAIDAERNALLTRLLGAGWDATLAESDRIPLALVGPVLGNLSDEVKASVQEIAARSADRMRDYLAQRQSAGENPNPAELARMREETRQQLAAVLNPQQLEEFLLRYSDSASALRQELAGFNATPEEFRALFRAVDSIDREIQARFSGTDAASVRSRQGLEQQRLTAIRNAVGPQRFAAYQTLHDPAYREALAVAQQAGGGDETAQALYTINRATAEELNRIRNDTTLNALQRQQLLRETEAEQQRARSLVLGETPAEEIAPTATAPVQAEPPVRGHMLIPGDTLGILALQYGVPVSVIRAANPGVDINRARPGTVVAIPSNPGNVPLPYPPNLTR
jgi:LysM repeat protein